MPTVKDPSQRPLRDLRISVTDRCNLRCSYCMPRAHFGPDFAFLPRAELLNYDEITRLVRVAVRHGVEKVRLTGGEPLIRKDLPILVHQLAALDGLRDVALTTNGALLKRHARALKRAGLRRVTVSLDTLNPTRFASISDATLSVSTVLEGIDEALSQGLAPLKVNMVVMRGTNDEDVEPMIRHFLGRPVIVRFIEFMDVGTTNGWDLSRVVPSAELIHRLQSSATMTPIEASYHGEVAKRWTYTRDGTSSEVGFISSVTQPFCGACTRLRLSADGKLFTCLFATKGHDVRAVLRSTTDDSNVDAFLSSLWSTRTDRYSERRSNDTRDLPKIEMSYIGG